MYTSADTYVFADVFADVVTALCEHLRLVHVLTALRPFTLRERLWLLLGARVTIVPEWDTGVSGRHYAGAVVSEPSPHVVSWLLIAGGLPLVVFLSWLVASRF